MLIELDLKEVKRLKITVNQFILIILLIEKHDIKSLLDVIPISAFDINNLITRGILTKESVLDPTDYSKLQVSEEFIIKLSTKNFFDEFFDLYPIAVSRPDGQRDYLRGDISRCRKYYDKIVGKSRSKHDHMITCLKFEIENRKKSGSLSFMKRMAKWLLSEEWLIYEEYLKDTESNKLEAKDIYGTDVE